MILKILITLVSFILFIYMFYFKLIKKNDTNYVIILGIQAFGVLKGTFWYIIVYLFAIIIPALVFLLEYKKINISELMYVFISRICILLGKEKKAKEYLIDLTDKYPESYGAHKMLAEIYEKEGGMRRAIEEYVKTLEIRRNDYKSYYKISTLLKDLGRNKQAILMLNNLLKVKPDHYMAIKMLSDLLIESEDYKQAISVINKALKHYENDEELIYDLGIAYAKINEFNLAKKCFEQVTILNNQNYNAYYRLGQIALLYRDFDMAEKYFSNSAFEEKEAKSYYELTKVYMIKNQKDKAATTLEKAININSKYYVIAKEEPMFYPIKQFIKPAKSNNNENANNNEYESKKEKMIEEYLNDTYNLTKVLNAKEENKKKDYNWKKKKKKRYN